MTDLLKRLRALKYTRGRGDGPNGEYFTERCDADDYGAEATPINPDGPEAADRITAMKAAGDGLEEALGDLLGATEEVGYVHYAPFRAKARSAIKQWKEASDGL